ncbi:hypothetical protein BpHYR1_000561 [Brachionus plicatilis]|uniref:Uncharacterized protein n=1 Tax=Brachionus plicatilis TaxID=10195 RepID=A0A3M7R3W0_BRAPC|nr:hypothetical protein BpHYR1_000561 [Brachionus plicatilis]
MFKSNSLKRNSVIFCRRSNHYSDFKGISLLLNLTKAFKSIKLNIPNLILPTKILYEIANQNNHSNRGNGFEIINDIYSLNKAAPTIKLFINNKEKTCLVDSGAKTSFLGENYALRENLILSPIKNPKNWITANELTLKTIGQTTLSFTIGSK